MLCAACAAPLGAATFYVSSSGAHQSPFDKWDNAATSIQAAVDAAPFGATILVKSGKYTGEGDNVVTINKPLALQGESGNQTDVIIDGEGARRGILAELTNDNASVIISGITLTNCRSAQGFGGGLASRGKPGSEFIAVITGCVFSANIAAGPNARGGGAACMHTRLTIANCRLENNRTDCGDEKKQSTCGGGLYVAHAPSGSIILNTEFRGNAAIGGGGGTTGGGLKIEGANTGLVLEHCSFDRNVAPYGSDLMQESGKLTLRNCRFSKSPAGRALWLGWAKSSPTTMIFNCIIAGGIHATENADLKASDALKDPAVYLDESCDIKPVRTLEEWNRRRALIISRIEQVAGPLPDKSLFPDPELKVLKDEVIEGCLRRQMIEYNSESAAAPRIKAWLFSPATNSCLDAVPSGQKRRPALLCPHQTNRTTGKNEPAGLEGDANMFYAIELARRGFVTLAPDFTGSGEHPGLSTYSNEFASATMKGVSDHIRAVDILSKMPGVDPERIGCVGHSLGGFNTMMVSVFEPRIKAIVSSCGYVNWQTYADREGSLYLMAGGNYMPRLNRDYMCRSDLVPFDWHEVVAACAPRPLFVNAPLRDDPFLVEGVCETIEAARPIYKLYGAADVIQTTHPDCGHGFPPEVREKAYRFLERQLAD